MSATTAFERLVRIHEMLDPGGGSCKSIEELVRESRERERLMGRYGEAALRRATVDPAEPEITEVRVPETLTITLPRAGMPLAALAERLATLAGEGWVHTGTVQVMREGQRDGRYWSGETWSGETQLVFQRGVR